MTTPAVKPKSTRVILRNVRGSYLNLFTPRAQEENQTPKYSAAWLFDKEALDPKSETPAAKSFRELVAAVKSVIKEAWGDKVPDNVKSPIHKGTERANDDGTYPSGYSADMVYINTSSKEKPGVIDQAKQDITDPALAPSGYYYNVSVTVFAFGVSAEARKRTGGNRGVAFGLGNVQLVRAGERFDGRRAAKDEFDEIDGGDEGSVEDLDSLLA